MQIFPSCYFIYMFWYRNNIKHFWKYLQVGCGRSYFYCYFSLHLHLLYWKISEKFNYKDSLWKSFVIKEGIFHLPDIPWVGN